MPRDKIINLDDYENLFVRIHKDEKKELKKIAKAKRVSLSVLIRNCVEKLIEENK